MGLHWEKPVLNLIEWDGSKANNLVARHDNSDQFLYHALYDPADVPERRYKALFGIGKRQPAVSADGLHWSLLPTPSIPSADESQLIYDELGKQFLSTVKHTGPYGRSVYLTTSKNFNEWTEPKLIFHADGYDQELGRQRLADRMSNPRWVPLTINQPSQYNVDIYNMPVFPYEGHYIGLPMKFSPEWAYADRKLRWLSPGRDGLESRSAPMVSRGWPACLHSSFLCWT